MDVVLYLRYSSDKQTEQSIEGQMRVCKAYCEQIGYNIVDMYIDRALSASKDTQKRLDFIRMIKDSEKHLWQGVVVYKLDRFARNRYDSAVYKARLKKNGVRVISATENISDSPEGVILEAVLEGMAEFYSKELSQKVTRGMRETALKCNSCGGHIPVGYNIENKKLVIDPIMAPLVREAFTLYADGWSVASIYKMFNEAGYKTRRGTPFNKSSFRLMFRNKKYIGVYRYDNIEIEGGVPPIVDKETFDRVQERIDREKLAPPRGKPVVDYMLSGKIFCGHCGKPMVGSSGTSRAGNKYYYYECSTHRKLGTCNKKAVRKEFIEQAVVEDALTLFTPDFIEYLADLTMDGAMEEIEHNTLIPTLKAKIKETELAIKRLLRLVEDGSDSPSLAKRLNELEKEKKAAEKELVKEEKSVITFTKEDIVEFLNEVLLGDEEDPDFQRHIIDMLVNSVYVWDDDDDGGTKITIYFNLVPKVKHTISAKELSRMDHQVVHVRTLPREFKVFILAKILVFGVITKHRF